MCRVIHLIIQINFVYILGSLSARFDHMMSNVDVLFRVDSKIVSIVLLSAYSYVILLCEVCCVCN